MDIQQNQHSESYRSYVWVWVILIILTGLTVGVAYLDFGSLSTLISIGIASVKAVLVLLFFMHLKTEGKPVKYTFIASTMILAIFIMGVYGDITFLLRN